MATSIVHLPDAFAIDEKASLGLIDRSQYSALLSKPTSPHLKHEASKVAFSYP